VGNVIVCANKPVLKNKPIIPTIVVIEIIFRFLFLTEPGKQLVMIVLIIVVI